MNNRDTFPPDQGYLERGSPRTSGDFVFQQLEEEKRKSQVLGQRIQLLQETVKAVVPAVNLRENQYGDPVLRGSYALVKDSRAPLFATESDQRERIRRMTGMKEVDFLDYDAVYQTMLRLPRTVAVENLLALYRRQEQAKRDLIQAAREMEGEVAAFTEEVLQRGTREYREVKPILEDFMSVEQRVYFRN